ncbi:MAG: alpha/beta hydrolase [Planctomycetes bacterium]|nr:alpha/beta hydrolase [Planctomycetota bacterium]
MQGKTPDTTLWPWLWRIARSVLAVYLLVVVLVYLIQRRLQYFPDPSPVPLPRGEKYKGLEEVQLTTADGLRLSAWHWPGAKAPPETLVIFHGNGGHRGHRLEWIEDLHGLGFGIFILDYRGYGGSEGAPSEEGLYRDGEAAVLWLEEHVAGKRIYFGESLGCAVAVELAVRHPPAALVLQSSFVAAVDVARQAYPFLPVRLLMKDRYDLRGRLARISPPALVIHGDRDQIVPMAMGKELFDALPGPKEWYVVHGADHNDLPWVGGREYLQKIAAAMKN